MAKLVITNVTPGLNKISKRVFKILEFSPEPEVRKFHLLWRDENGTPVLNHLGEKQFHTVERLEYFGNGGLATRTVWENSILFNASVGEIANGTIHTRMVEPYELTDDRTITIMYTYTTVVFDGEDVGAAFLQEGRRLVSGDGSPATVKSMEDQD